MRMFLALAACSALTLLAAGAAHAAGEPWEGGPDVRSPVEQKMIDVAAAVPEFAGFEYVCLSPEEWTGVLPPEEVTVVWGFVAPEVAPAVAWLSPQACTGVQRIIAGRKGAKMCLSGTTPVYQTLAKSQSYWTWVTKRKLVKRKPKPVWKSVRVRVKRQRVVHVQQQVGEEPVYGVECTDWEDTLFGAQTVAHETYHMHDASLSEAVVECYGMQDLAWWIYGLSGDGEFGIEAALEYATYYAAERIYDPVYGSADCRYQGPLDLSPENDWPWHPPGTGAA